MMRAAAIAGLVILALAGAVQGEEIHLSADEIDNLGIRFEKLSAAGAAAGIEATARVVLPPAADTVISTPQTGLLSRLAVSVGDAVVEGQVLAELNSPAFISLQREFLDALNAQRLARAEYQRDAQMHEEGIISARRLQQATTRKAVADAALNEHRQLLGLAGMRDTEVRSLESGQRLLGSLAVRAPFSGVIAERMASTGERLDAMSPVYRLIDLSELWLDISATREQLALVRTGARVATSGQSGIHTGQVATIGRVVDPETQVAVVRARLSAGATSLMPGQFVPVRIFLDDGNSTTAAIHEVPATAVTRSGTGSYVFVRSQAGVEVIEVNVVSINGDRASISGKLDDGAAIAASGLSALKSLMLAAAEEGS